MNWTLLQKAKSELIEAQETIRQAEIEATKEEGDNLAWKKIQEELGL